MIKLALAQRLLDDFQHEYSNGEPNALLIQGLPESLQPLVDELCLAYANASPEECAQVRWIISADSVLQGCFLGNVIRAAHAIRSKADFNWLAIGLASISIENCDQDYRDDLMVMAELYVCAEKAKLDAKKAFNDMAERSGDEKTRGGFGSMKRTLVDFGSSSFVAERRRMKKSYFPQSKNKKVDTK